MRGKSERILGWFDISDPNMLRVRGRRQVSRRKGGMTILRIVSSFLTSEVSSLNAFSSFNWGELGQSDSINLHSIGVLLDTGGEMNLGHDSSSSKGKDTHLLGMEDLGMINPSSDGSRDGGHGEDHRGNLLINSKGELINEMEFLLDSCFEQRVLKVSDVVLESIISGSIILLEGLLHEFGELSVGSGFDVEGVEGGLEILGEFVEGFLKVGD